MYSTKFYIASILLVTLITNTYPQSNLFVVANDDSSGYSTDNSDLDLGMNSDIGSDSEDGNGSTSDDSEDDSSSSESDDDSSSSESESDSDQENDNTCSEDDNMEEVGDGDESMGGEEYSNNSNDGDNMEEDSSDDEDDQLQWTKRDPHDVHEDFKIPDKITMFDLAGCKARIPRQSCDHQYMTPRQTKAWNRANSICMNECEGFHEITPEDFTVLLHDITGRKYGQCVYVFLQYTTFTQYMAMVKIGMAGQCMERIKQQIKVGQEHHIYVLMPPENMVDEKFVHPDVVDELMELSDKLPMTGGFSSDNLVKVRDIIVRQQGEANPTCSYDVKPGKILEWLLRCPSEREGELLDIVGILDNIIDNYETDILALFGTGEEFEGVLMIDTWITIGSMLRTERFKKIHHFLHHRPESFTEHLFYRVFDETIWVEHVDAIDEAPYYKQIKPMLDRIKSILRDNSLTDATKRAQLQIEFDKFSKETYQYPEEGEIEDGTLAKIQEIYADDAYNDYLIIFRQQPIEQLKSKYPQEHEEFFPSSNELVIKDKKVKRTNNNEVDIVTEDKGHVMHYSDTHCKRSLQTKSHFLMTAPNTRHTIMQNAIRNYLQWVGILYVLDVVDKESLDDTKLMMMSILLLLDGPTGSINIKDGEGGSLSDIYTLVFPERARPGNHHGQYYTDPAFRYTIHRDDSSDDEEDEMAEASKKKSIPYEAQLAILHHIGKDMFNEILRLFGVTNAKVAKYSGKYYLTIKVGNSNDFVPYWMHHDKVFGDTLDDTIEIITEYENDEEDRADWLIQGTFNNGVFNNVPLGEDNNLYTLQKVFDILESLYTDVDDCDERIKLMDQRFSNLWKRMLKDRGYKLYNTDGRNVDEDGKDDGLMFYLKVFSTPQNWNKLQEFKRKIASMEAGVDMGPSNNDIRIPINKSATEKYFTRLRKDDSLLARLLKIAMDGTKYEYLSDQSKYDEALLASWRSRNQNEHDQIVGDELDDLMDSIF